MILDCVTWPSPITVETDGVRLAVYAAGERSARPPIVLCHGFPEIAYSWRRQLSALALGGYRVLAPDQRGYGLSDAPPEVDAYRIETLGADLLGLLDAEGAEQAIFVGHDWGGLIVWDLVRRHPARVAGAIVLNTPLLPRLPADPIEIMRTVLGEDNYIVAFQQSDTPERLLEANLEKTLRCFFRRGDITPEDYLQLPKGRRSLALLKGLEAFDLANPGNQLLSDTDLAVYLAAFQRSGFRGPVNWYRNWTANWANSAHLPDRVERPCLMLTAENDVVLPPSMAEGMPALIPDLETVLIRNSGHWTQQEQPDAVNAAMLDWLGRRFG